MVSSPRAWLLAAGLATVACSRAAHAPAALAITSSAEPRAVPHLCVTSGRVEALRPGVFRVDVGGMRAVAPARASSMAELAFTYRGPSRDVQPLASGEVRRQIGLKLRAQSTCNVVYVMWHVEPTPGVFVSVKHNPGASTHAECGARGYINLKSERAKPAPAIAPGELHTLRATIDGRVLRAYADGALAWEGALPPEAFTFDGPAGVRSDNGAFELELRVPGGDGADASGREGECPPKGAE